jgi:hypothetical protein
MMKFKVNKSNTHKFTTMMTMRDNSRLIMNLGGIQGNPEKKTNTEVMKILLRLASNGGILPPPVVKTVISSSQLLTSSNGIGEFGMNPACRGSAVAFYMAVKDHLFFLKGTNASLDFSMDAPLLFVASYKSATVCPKQMLTSGRMTTL